MKYELRVFVPGVEGYDKKTGQPRAYAPSISFFEAPCATAAMVTARDLYKAYGLGVRGHFNISREA